MRVEKITVEPGGKVVVSTPDGVVEILGVPAANAPKVDLHPRWPVTFENEGDSRIVVCWATDAGWAREIAEALDRAVNSGTFTVGEAR